MTDSLISHIAPHNCLVCGFEGSLLCESCLSAELIELPSRCYRCHKISPDHAVCSSCRKSVKIDHVWIATEYDQIPKELIHKFKFERAIAAADPIAGKIDQILPNLPERTIVCHVPTASSRVRLRGYDQAEQIAKRLAKIRHYPREKFLIRTGKSRQVGSGRKDRFKQLEGVFRLRNTDKLIGANILLIDDVTTTGATIETAARLLKISGASQVNVAVFAQPQI